MYHNYFKIAIRLILRKPFFAAINVVGLSIGIASFIVLWQYASTELRSDQFHRDADRIVRIGFDWRETILKENAAHVVMGVSRSSLLPQLKNDFPEVESYVRILQQGGFFQKELVSHGIRLVFSCQDENGSKRIFKETNAAYADKNLFEFFTIPLLAGDPKTVLREPNTVVLSQRTAIKYFGVRDPVGEILTLNDSTSLRITGVFQNLPHNTHLNMDLVMSNENLLTRWSKVTWGGVVSYVKFRPETFSSNFEHKLNENKHKYWDDLAVIFPDNEATMFVQPLKDIAFSNFAGDDVAKQKSKTILVILAVIAITVLLMAWINYVNLSVSGTHSRMKEIATRRANGARTGDVMRQFLVESLLIHMVSVGLAFTLLQGVRVPVANLFDIHVSEFKFMEPVTWLVIAGTLVVGILITGLYPALVSLSRHPRSLLIMKTDSGSKGILPAMLTTLQYSAAIVLIVWVFVVDRQLNFILDRNIGLNREGVVVIEGPVVKSKQYELDAETFLNQLKNVNIHRSAFSRYMIGENSNKPGLLKRIGSQVVTASNENGVSENFISFFEIRLLAGRDFIRDDRDDVIIVSKITAQQLGFKKVEEAVGSRVLAGTGDWNNEVTAEIIGVIEDFQLRPAFNDIESFAGREGSFLTYKNRLFADLVPEMLLIKINLNNIDEQVEQAGRLFNRMFPGNVFVWRFLDEQVNQSYHGEKITRNQILLFTFLAIGISCLGLLAMIANRVNEKTKEIGIRKILGARSIHIGSLLLSTTIQHISVAVLFGIPLGYYLGLQYLERYSERITLTWWYSIPPVVIQLTIMLLTIVAAVVKAISANPVDSLRYE